MALTLDKPNWWDDLADFFSFSNSSSSTISSDDLYETLNTYVAGDIEDLLSSSFLSGRSHVIKGNSEADRLLGSSSDDTIIGYASVDYISGGNGDDILIGGTDQDYFNPGRGIDLVIGGTDSNENDTVSYLMATGGITVLPAGNTPEGSTTTTTTSSGGSSLLPGQDVYTIDYSTWLSGSSITISGFDTGPGGDYLDFSAILDAVGYTGSDPVGDGYIRLASLSSGMKLQFDPDGFGGESARQLVKLTGVSVSEFSVADNLLTEPLSDSGDGSGDGSGGSGGGSDVGGLFSLVSNDGQGDYDVLYSVENILGSDYADEIHGQDNVANILYGNLGNDALYGEGGDDTLVGGAGNDTMHGGSGNDLLILGSGNDQAWGDSGDDTFKITREILADIGDNAPTIKDFETGSGGDKLDVSEILDLIGYDGSNPFGDHILSLVQDGSNLLVKLDTDGTGSDASPQTIATLENVSQSDFSTSANLVTQAQTILFTGVLGQSNADGLRVFGGDSESGLTRLHDGLDDDTDYDVIFTPPDDENGATLRLTVGGTQVNGDEGGDLDNSWWFLSTGTPGEILIRAVSALSIQIAELRAQGAVKPIIIWGQGESDAYAIGSKSSESARNAAQDAYIAATLAVFDYIKDHIGQDVTFYIMKTGRFHEGAAHNDGLSQDVIDDTLLGVQMVREAQDEMIAMRDDIRFGADYVDLPMNADYDDDSTDVWHYDPEDREIIGDRLAANISADLNNGETLPSTPPSGGDGSGDGSGGDTDPPPSDGGDTDPPPPAATDADLVLSGDVGNNTLSGGSGNDTLKGREGNDSLYGNDGNDTLWGNEGDDVLYGGAGSDWMKGSDGADTFVFGEGALEGVDTIADLRVNSGDMIAFDDTLFDSDPLAGAINDFIRFTENGGNTLLSVDTNGSAGGANFVQIAEIIGITGLGDAQNMLDGGHIAIV